MDKKRKKQLQKAYKKWYLKLSPEDKKKRLKYITDSARNRRKEQRKWLMELKSKKSCEECGENRVLCLDFHHKEKSKDFSIARGINRTYSKRKILKELKKCIVLCANCHRIKHGTTTNQPGATTQPPAGIGQ